MTTVFFSKIKSGLSHFMSREYAILAILIEVSLFLRLYKLPELMIFTYDQGRDLFVLSEIASGNLKLVGPTTGIEGFFLGPFFYYILMPGYFLGNGNPVVVGAWVALISSIALFFAYELLKSILGKNWALLGTWLLMISPGAIDDSRTIWNPSLAAPALLLSWWSLEKSQRQPWYAVLAYFAYALSLQTELAYTFFLFPAYLGWLILHWPLKLPFISKWQNQKYSWKVVLAIAAICFSTLIPQLAFELKNNFVITKAITREIQNTDKNVTLGKLWSERPDQMAYVLTERVFGRMPGSEWYLIGVLVLLMIIPISRVSSFKRFLYWQAVLPLFGLMFAIGNHGNFFSYYLAPHYLPIIICLMIVSKILVGRSWKRLWIVIGTLFIFSAAAFIYNAKVIYNSQLIEYTISRQISALQYSRQTHFTDDYAAEAFVPNLLPYQYQYLQFWLEKTGQMEKVDFWIHQHNEYFLIYEPYLGDSSFVAFEEWYQRHAQWGECQKVEKFGIITVEHCFRHPQPDDSPANQ